MKLMQLQLVVLLSALFISAAVSDELSDDDLSDEFDEQDEELLNKLEEEHVEKEIEKENRRAKELAEKIAAAHYNFGDLETAPKLINPCKEVPCGAGRICMADGKDASCVCIPECPEEADPRRKVCTNLNETWASACEVHRQRCLCNTKDERCQGSEFAHVHIDYYGECKEIVECSEDDMLDFPRRMRDWLFNVMRDLASRHELAETYMELSHEAETNMTKRWTNAAIWKWCDLDGHPHDNSVSRHELFPIRAPLMSLEQCIAPFLESCDSNNDHRITLQEWGKCLQLEEEDLTERCAEITKEEAKKDLEAEFL